MTASFWHIGFLISMGFATSFLLFNSINTLRTANNTVPFDKAFRIFFYGALYGAVDYLSGVAVKYNKYTIMKMVSFSAKEFYKTTTIATVFTDPSGQTTSSATINTYGDYFKNFLALDEMLSKWP